MLTFSSFSFLRSKKCRKQNSFWAFLESDRPAISACTRTPGVNFMLHSVRSFYMCRSRKCKNDGQVVSFFALCVSVCAKVVCRMLVKLTLVLQGSILCYFLCADPESAKMTDKLLVFFALFVSVCAKVVCRMLMKLTPEVDFANEFGRTSFTNKTLPNCTSKRNHVEIDPRRQPYKIYLVYRKELVLNLFTVHFINLYFNIAVVLS